MSNSTSDFCETIQPSLAAYALGEREIDGNIQAHLEGCASCRNDLLAYAQVARVLPYSAPDVAPPAALRERIIADASKPAITDTPKPFASARPALPASTPPADRRPRRLSAPWIGVACGIIALVALLGWNISLQQTIDRQTAQMATNRESWQTMIVLLNDPAIKWYMLSGDTARGHVWAAPGGTVGCLVVQGLPSISDDEVYQVWLMNNGEQIRVGTFEEHNGNAWTLIRADEALTAYTDIMVTVEPRTGSATPANRSVLRGTFSTAMEREPGARQMWLSMLAQEAPRDD